MTPAMSAIRNTRRRQGVQRLWAVLARPGRSRVLSSLDQQPLATSMKNEQQYQVGNVEERVTSLVDTFI